MTSIAPAPLRVLVAGASVAPDGGTRATLVHTLVAHLRRRGHEADSVVLPSHAEHALDHACAWRMLNLSSSNARPIDLVIATAFPAWCARHSRKVAWIADDDGLAADEGNGGSHRLVELDARALAECRHVFAGRVSTAERVRRRSGIEAGLLAPPLHDQPLAWDIIIEQLLG